ADNIWTNASSDEKILLNRFSLDAESKTVEVFLKAGTTGIHHLDFSGITSFNKYNCIWLENTENGEVVNIFKENSYKFNVSDTNDIQKFLIHFENRFDCFASNSQIKTNTLSDNTMIFNNGSGVFVKFNFEEVKNIELSVYNLQGQEVLKNQSLQVVNELLPLQLPSENQLYIVRIKSGDQILTRKIYF
ncbi:MAG: T9SS type A sorting domain-containing protein, partial [Bacteroidota bacterium]